MSELLRLANELVEDMFESRTRGECRRNDVCIYVDEAEKVIKGYQELIRRMAGMLEANSLEWSSYGYGLWSQKIDTMVDEARASIPQEPSNG